MRSYPHDSPQAAARILALTMFADSHLARAEWDVLVRSGALVRIGLGPGEWDQLLEECCQDLLAQGHLSWDRSCRIEDATLRQVLAEIDDPGLQRCIAGTCSLLVAADGEITQGEWRILRAVIRQWGLSAEVMPQFGSRA